MTEDKKWFAVKGQVIKFKVLDFDWEVVKATAGDESDWLPYYLKIKKTGETYSNIAELRICKLTKAKAVPWEADRPWREATFDERREALRDLEPEVLSKILIAFSKSELLEVDKKKV